MSLFPGGLLKCAKTHGKIYTKVGPPLVYHLLRNRLLGPVVQCYVAKYAVEFTVE